MVQSQIEYVNRSIELSVVFRLRRISSTSSSNSSK